MTEPSRPTAEVIDSATGLALEPGGTETMALMVSDLPEIDPDEAVERILSQLLAAKTAADLNAPWESAGLEAYLDHPLELLSVGRAPSDYDGIGVFLVVTAKSVRTGEPVVLSTGSVSVMAQLIMAHRNGWLPIVATPRAGKRKTRKGFTAHHLEFLAPRVGG